MKKPGFFCLFLFFLFIYLKSHAQKLPPAETLSPYSIEWFSSDDGQLPQNSVKSIVKDKYDFIWMVTEGGIVRYDGREFVTYKTEMSQENRNSLFEGTSKGDFLFTFMDPAENGYINLVSGRNCLAWKLNPADKKFSGLGDGAFHRAIRTRFQGGSTHKYLFMIDDRRFYILENFQLTSYKENKKEFTKDFTGYNYFKFFLYDDSLYYFKDNMHIRKIGNEGGVTDLTTNLNAGEEYIIINNLPNQQFFIVTKNKIYLADDLEKNKFNFTKIYEGTDFDLSTLRTLYYDRKDKIIFLGDDIKGLKIIKKKSVKVFRNPDPEARNSYYSLIPFSSNSVLTPQGYVFSDNGRLENLNFNRENDLMAIISYNDRYKFIKRGINLFLFDRLDNKEEKLITFDAPNEFINTIAAGKGDKVWIALNKQLGYFFLKEKKITGMELFPVSNPIRAIYEIDDEAVLLGTRQGLEVFNPQTRTLTHKLPGVNIRAISSQDGINIWLFTYGKGFYLYRDGKIIPFTIPPDYKQLETAHTIVEDKKGYYWISTNNGLFQASKKSFLNYILNKDPFIFLYKYNKKDGLLTNEFNGGAVNCGLILPDDNIVLPSINGMVFVDTQTIHPVLASESFYLDRALLDGNEIRTGKKINLASNFYNLKIFVDCPNYGNPDNLNMEYSLDDSDMWISVENKTIQLSGLSPRAHTLYVRKLKSFEGGYDYRKTEIYVEPSFWESWWFTGLCILFLGVLIFLFVKLRLAYIKKENIKLNKKIDEHTLKQKEIIESLTNTRKELNVQIDNQKRLIRTVTHDIKSPLKFLKMGTTYLVENNKNEDRDFNAILQSVYESLFQTYTFVDNTLSYSKAFLFMENEKKEIVNLQKIFNEKISLFGKMAGFKNIEIISLLEKPFGFYVNPTLLSIIIHNLIDNSIKNSEGGTIRLNATRQGESVSVIIEDTGKGMTPEQIESYFGQDQVDDGNKGVGIKIIKELLDSMDGELRVSGEIGKGTRVELFFSGD